MLHQSSRLVLIVTVAFPACMAGLVSPGYRAVTDEMVVMEPQVNRVNQGVLGPQDLAVPKDLLVLMERMVPREHLETKAHAVRKESAVQCL